MFDIAVQPDWEGLLRNLRRAGTPERVYHMELFLDAEVRQALHARFGIADHLDRADPFFPQKAFIALYRFLGYDIADSLTTSIDIIRRIHVIADPRLVCAEATNARTRCVISISRVC